MSPISCERKSNVESYGINMDDVYFRGGASGRVGKSIDVDKQDLYDADEVNSKLKCTRNESHWQVAKSGHLKSLLIFSKLFFSLLSNMNIFQNDFITQKMTELKMYFLQWMINGLLKGN